LQCSAEKIWDKNSKIVQKAFDLEVHKLATQAQPRFLQIVYVVYSQLLKPRLQRLS